MRRVLLSLWTDGGAVLLRFCLCQALMRLSVFLLLHSSKARPEGTRWRDNVPQLAWEPPRAPEGAGRMKGGYWGDGGRILG